jgi:hypothetical protein
MLARAGTMLRRLLGDVRTRVEGGGSPIALYKFL